ncbi:MAG: PH domain-containing protein [candidate division Zixibacteria bacterium]|nr:PH domain-containing protein [candidate division Zixibacteria bacterium]
MRFGAPWSTSVKWITGITVTFLAILVVFGISQVEEIGSGSSILLALLTVVLPALVLVLSACWMIRGFVLSGDLLLIQRLGWKSRMDLTELVSADADPEAMDKSLRTWGNGGIFCFCGRFRNTKLGAYRAYATDPKRSVVLKFQDQTVVVTPDRPDDFVASISERIAL